MEIGRLIGIKEFEGERENFVLNTFIDFKPVKRFEDRSSMSESGSPNNSPSERVLDQFESMELGLWKVAVQRITVVKFGVYSGSCDKTGCFGIKVRTDVPTNVPMCTIPMGSCTCRHQPTTTLHLYTCSFNFRSFCALRYRLTNKSVTK